MPNIYTLSQINDSDINKIGYRAWSIAKAHQNKFQVPLSFIVPNHIFEEFLIQNRLNIDLRNILLGKSLDNLEELRILYPRIKEAFAKAKIPEEYLDQLKEAYASLAVPTERNSAEDLLKEEDATINLITSADYRTSSDDINGFIMNLKGFNSFIIGLKSAWLSLYSPEQMQYRHRKNIREFNVGVLVQRMINADVTMEVFSKGPLGDYEIIVKSYQGLPDKTSSITKDVYSVSKDYLKIQSSRIARQEFKIVKGEKNGSLEKRHLGPRGEEQKLPDKDILESARICKRLLSILGSDFKAFFESKKGKLFLIMINLFPDSIKENEAKVSVSVAVNELIQEPQKSILEPQNEESEPELMEEVNESEIPEIHEGDGQKSIIIDEEDYEEKVLQKHYEEIGETLEEPEVEVKEEQTSEPQIEIFEEEPKDTEQQNVQIKEQSAQELLDEMDAEEINWEDEEKFREQSEKKEREGNDDDFILSEKED